MAIRLSHVLIAMGLILLGGILSVRHLERRMGGATVPGVVLVEAPGLGPAGLAALEAAWPDGTRERIPVGSGHLRPFGPRLLSRLVERGDWTCLLSLDPDFDGSAAALWEGAWLEVVDRVQPTPESISRGDRLIDLASDLVRTLRTTRAFFVAVVLDDEEEPADPADRLAPLREAIESLPSFRRSALVVMGPRDATGHRDVVRLNLGRWGPRSRPALADLLDTRW